MGWQLGSTYLEGQIYAHGAMCLLSPRAPPAEVSHASREDEDGDLDLSSAV